MTSRANNLESEAKSKRKRQNIQKIVLGTVQAAGILSFSLLAPNALQVLEQVDPNFKKRKKNPKYTIDNSISKLLTKKLIAFETTSRGKCIRLTPLGEKTLRELNFDRVHQQQRKKKWDKRWRIIIFDIKEERKHIRDKIRYQLERIGFYRLQNSVWVYPYNCEELITMIKAELHIGKDVLYIIAETIENDKAVRKHFNL